MSSADILKTTNSVLCGLQLILGSIGNLIVIVICARKRLRTNPTFIIIGFNSFASTLGLLGWPFQFFIKYIFEFNMIKSNIYLCKIIFYLGLFPLQWSSWLLVKNNERMQVSLFYIFILLKGWYGF
jgi:hypothetical protein